MLKALLWKEWHEQRWRVALATVWLLGMSAIGLKTRILPDIAILMLTWAPMVLILPVFLGMGLFASERKAGTLPYLMVQPVGRGPILAAKVIAGLLAYATPVVIAGIAICLSVGGREMSTADLAGRIAVMAAFGGVLFLWQLLAGLRCRQEETYILMSAVVVGGWIIHGLVVDAWNLTQRFGHWIWAMNPIAIVEVFDSWEDRQALEILTIVTVQSLILVGLACGLWFRFRRLRESKS
jgi:hypothetical protein